MVPNEHSELASGEQDHGPKDATPQQLHICSEGWHFDPDSLELRIVGGGEISARFVTPRPFGEPPLPKSEWPSRAELLKRKAWSARPE
jgi:hypothetical protein